MNPIENAWRWGLPEGFVPVRHPIDDEIKSLLRPMLDASEPVVVTLENIEGVVSVVATSKRLFVVRSGDTSAGITGFSVREFPWIGVTKLTLSHAGTNVKLSIGFRTSNGRTAEVGRKAALGRDATENAMPFDASTGHDAYAALHQIWQHVQQIPTE